uniref:Uncharacterized protein n=1 Tax=Oryza brachyantha TaxID=4533 RepID=J3LCX1_ORYBR
MNIFDSGITLMHANILKQNRYVFSPKILANQIKLLVFLYKLHTPLTLVHTQLNHGRKTSIVYHQESSYRVFHTDPDHQGSPYHTSHQNRGTVLPRIPHGNRKNRDEFESKKFEFKLVRFSRLTAR